MLLVDGYTSTVSTAYRGNGSEPRQKLLRFGLNAKRQRDVPAHLGAVVGVSAGYRRTCAIRSDGQLVCFGLNDDAQCDVPMVSGAVVTFSAGTGHTCAVRSDGQLVCFGWNGDGQM